MTVIGALSSFRKRGEMSLPNALVRRQLANLMVLNKPTIAGHQRPLPPQSNSLRRLAHTPVLLPMAEDSLAPNRGVGGSRCNAEVLRWSFAKKDLPSGIAMCIA
jgi:hypothetical protein